MAEPQISRITSTKTSSSWVCHCNCHTHSPQYDEICIAFAIVFFSWCVITFAQTRLSYIFEHFPHMPFMLWSIWVISYLSLLVSLICSSRL